MFEIVSGFTTTGSSILSKVEDMSHATLMWRSFSHWIGGMGILFSFWRSFLWQEITTCILCGQEPGPSVGKLVPKIRITAKLLYSIYFFMTVVMFLLLLLGRMPVFDSICMSFGAAGTGGFSCRNSGQAGYTVYQQGVITTFMLLFGVNFNVYYLLLIRRAKDAFRCEELRGYVAIVAVSILLITLNVRNMFPSLFAAFHHAAFQVAAIITTTGYATADFNTWPEFSKTILFDYYVHRSMCRKHRRRYEGVKDHDGIQRGKGRCPRMIHPRSVKVLKYEGKALEHNTLRSLNAYIIVYFMIFFLSVLIISLDNFDFMTSFSAVTANLNNIGPGMSVVHYV